MNPHPEDVLAELSKQLASELAPVVQPVYLGAVLSYSGMLLSAAAEEWDRAAWRLREDNRALRMLFSAVRPLLRDHALAALLAQHISSDDDDIHVKALRKTNEAMRQTLALAHAAIEETPGQAAREAEARIWRELAVATERRRTSVELF